MKEGKLQIKPIAEAPNLAILKERFGVLEDEVIVAYGNKIYCPAKGMSKDLLAHELTHCQRQGMNERQAERWWERYLTDIDFRLNEELLAFQAQFDFCKKAYKDRNKLAKIKFALASELASSRYGGIIKHSEAMIRLK